MNNAVDKLQHRGVIAARASTAQLRSEVLNGMIRRHYVPGVRKLVMDSLLELLTDAMVSAHLKATSTNVLKLSVYDETMKVLARKSKANLDELQVQYKTRALKVLDGVSGNMEKKLGDTLNDLMRKGAHVDEAISVINDEFDKLGLSPQADYALETMFRTQSQIAYGAGRWEADQDPDIQEILWGYTYSAVGDDRTRETHAAMDGVTLPKEDPFWQRWWPPNGWNCRCQAIPLFAEEDIVEPDRSLLPDPGFGFNPGRVFAVTASFNPNQPRDADGKFGSGGGGGDKKALAAKNKQAIADRRAARKALAKAKKTGDLKKIQAAKLHLATKIAEATKAKAEYKAAIAAVKALKSAKSDKAKKDAVNKVADAKYAAKAEKTGDKWSKEDFEKRLKPSEVEALKAFTDGQYSQLRQAERSGKKLTGKAKALNDALDKAPTYAGITYRGMRIPPNDAARATFTTVGSTFKLNASSSSSKVPRVAVKFAKSSSAGSAVVLRVKGYSGVDISSVSYFKSEKEVLLRRGAKYRIVSTEISHGIQYVDCVEQ